MMKTLIDTLDLASKSRFKKKTTYPVDSLDLAFQSDKFDEVESRSLELSQLYQEAQEEKSFHDTKKLVDEINELAEAYSALFQTSGEAIEKFEAQNALLNETIKRYLLIYKNRTVDDSSLDPFFFRLFKQKKNLFFVRFLFHINLYQDKSLFLLENLFDREIVEFISLVASADFFLEESFNRSRAQLVHFFMSMRALIDYTTNYRSPRGLQKKYDYLDQQIFNALLNKVRSYGEESVGFMTNVVALYAYYVNTELNEKKTERPGYHAVYVYTHMLMFLPEIIDPDVFLTLAFSTVQDSFLDAISIPFLNTYLRFLEEAKNEVALRHDLDSLLSLWEEKKFPICFMPDFFFYLARRAKSARDSINEREDPDGHHYYWSLMETSKQKCLTIAKSNDLLDTDKNTVVCLMRRAEYRLKEDIRKTSRKGTTLSEEERQWFLQFSRSSQKEFVEESQGSCSHAQPTRVAHHEATCPSMREVDTWEGETLPIAPFGRQPLDKEAAALRKKCDTFFASSSREWDDQAFRSLANKAHRFFWPEETQNFYKKAINTCLAIAKNHQYCHWMIYFVNRNAQGKWDWARCTHGNDGREYVKIAQDHFIEGLEYIQKAIRLLDEAEMEESEQDFLIEKKVRIQSELALMKEGLNAFHKDSQEKAIFFRDRARSRREAKEALQSGEPDLTQVWREPMAETKLHKKGHFFFDQTMQEIKRLNKLAFRS